MCRWTLCMTFNDSLCVYLLGTWPHVKSYQTVAIASIQDGRLFAAGVWILDAGVWLRRLAAKLKPYSFWRGCFQWWSVDVEYGMTFFSKRAILWSNAVSSVYIKQFLTNTVWRDDITCGGVVSNLVLTIDFVDCSHKFSSFYFWHGDVCVHGGVAWGRSWLT